MVESKKYPNKPSKMYIIQRRLNAPAYDLACNCEHSGVYPSPFNLCSHALACLISVCLKVGDISLLAMRDVAKRKEQEERDKDVPIVGNEYPDHTKQKVRAYQILKADGWETQYETEVVCFDEDTAEIKKYPYSLDVCAVKWFDNLQRRITIGVEVQREGPGGGHGSKITGPKDRNRAKEIWDQYQIMIIPFNVSHMKASTDEMILDEIYQRLGIVS